LIEDLRFALRKQQLRESLKDDPKFKAIVKSAQEERAALCVLVSEMEERRELTL
jgi:hypothetical protein